tara:strand:- start:2 stop:145 length:144 start_codon:yes stop_codon:yes gene_type:complete
MKENEFLRQLKEQLQINLLQVFEDVPVTDAVLDHMCTVIINTVNEAH